MYNTHCYVQASVAVFYESIAFCIDDNRQVNRWVIQQNEPHIGPQNIFLGINQVIAAKEDIFYS